MKPQQRHGRQGRWGMVGHWVGLLGAVLMVAACSGGGSSGSSASTSTTPTAAAGTAVLLPSVQWIDATQAQFVAASTDTTWTLTAPITVSPGTVLLLQDAAMKVVAVDTSSGQMVLTVTPAEISDVFSRLSISGALDLSHAEFIPDPNSPIQATFGPRSTASSSASDAAAVTNSVEKVLSFPYNDPPFSHNLEFTLRGDLQLDYSSASTNLTGQLDVTGTAKYTASISLDEGITFSKEVSVGALRIPIPISVADGLLKFFGIQTAALYIPVFVGGEATVQVKTGKVELSGGGQVQTVVSYDGTNGFSVTGPTLSKIPGLLTATPPSDIPTAVAKGSVTAGPFVRARPQLLVLNKVASIGADVKVWLLGQGTVQTMLDSPYYCLNLQPQAKGAAYGFFKGVGIAEKTSSPLTKTIDVAGPFNYPSDGCGTVQFEKDSYFAKPTDGRATITVTRTGDLSQAATVQYGTQAVTAVPGRDYIETFGTLTFNPQVTSQTFDVTIPSGSQGGIVGLGIINPSSLVKLGMPNRVQLKISPLVFAGTINTVGTHYRSEFNQINQIVSEINQTVTYTGQVIVFGDEAEGRWNVSSILHSDPEIGPLLWNLTMHPKVNGKLVSEVHQGPNNVGGTFRFEFNGTITDQALIGTLTTFSDGYDGGTYFYEQGTGSFSLPLVE